MYQMRRLSSFRTTRKDGNSQKPFGDVLCCKDYNIFNGGLSHQFFLSFRILLLLALTTTIKALTLVGAIGAVTMLDIVQCFHPLSL